MLPYYSFEHALRNLFFNSEIAYEHCLLTINSNCVSIIKTCEGLYKVFDSHSKDIYGIPDPNGKCVLVSINSIENLVTFFQNIVPYQSVTPFEMKGVTVELIAFESVEQTATSSQTTNANDCAKRQQKKHLVETESNKRIRLANAKIYQQAKRSAETESEAEVRSKNDKAYHKRRQTTESESDKQRRLETARIYKKRKQAENLEARNFDNQVDYLKKFDVRNGGIHEQAWTKFNMEKFSKTIKNFIVAQCTICREAWPVKSSLKRFEKYICQHRYATTPRLG